MCTRYGICDLSPFFGIDLGIVMLHRVFTIWLIDGDQQSQTRCGEGCQYYKKCVCVSLTFRLSPCWLILEFGVQAGDDLLFLFICCLLNVG